MPSHSAITAMDLGWATEPPHLGGPTKSQTMSRSLAAGQGRIGVDKGVRGSEQICMAEAWERESGLVLGPGLPG